MTRKRVLVCPMDWGLGHASRDVVLIRQLIRSGFEVIIGADKAPLLFLRQSFPDLPFIVIPSVNIHYPEKGSFMPLKMLFLMPNIISGIFKEHLFLKKILKSDKIDILISDNRYGLWNRSIYCIFITHQLRILAPKMLKWIEFPLMQLNKWFIKKFNECWVPDFEGNENLSGILSHLKKIPGNVQYIHPLSRFPTEKKKEILPVPFEANFDVLVILSGPEPQRSILEKIILLQASSVNLRFLVVQGKPELNVFAQSAGITIVNHLKSEHLEQLIRKTLVIIARSGYSTIMDLVSLQKSAILIPTPGQTEQVYLAKLMSEKNWFIRKIQDDFQLLNAIQEFQKFKPSPFPNIKSNFKERLNKLL